MSELSVQLYTVREALAEDFDGTLGKLASFGFTQVEPFALLNFADELRDGLAENGLTAPTTHVHLLGEDQDAVCALAAELGIQTVIEPYVDPARWQTEAGVSEIAAELNAAAIKAADYGLQVGYHNHHFELESMIDGVHALEVLADSAGAGSGARGGHLLGVRRRCRRARFAYPIRRSGRRFASQGWRRDSRYQQASPSGIGCVAGVGHRRRGS